jgi:hypothetical protein
VHPLTRIISTSNPWPNKVSLSQCGFGSVQRRFIADVLQRLVSAFRSTSLSSSDTPHATYHPALQPLYEQYVETLYNAVSIYTNDPLELQYVAAARWPGFVKPVISQYDELVQQAEEDGSDPPELELPGTDGRLRLFKFFLPTFTAALDALYPRLDNAADWAAKNDYDAGHREGLSNRVKAASSFKVDHLPRMSKFILIAAFVASTNPPKSDVRMFGRGPEERKKRRRKSGSPRKSGGAHTVVKVRARTLLFLTSHDRPFSFMLQGVSAVAWPCDVPVGQTACDLGRDRGGKRLRDASARPPIRTARRIHGHGNWPDSHLRRGRPFFPSSSEGQDMTTKWTLADHGADADAGVAPNERDRQAGRTPDVQMWDIARRGVGARTGSRRAAQRLDVGSNVRSATLVSVPVHSVY